MTKKILPLMAAFSTAFIFNACGDDSSSSANNYEESSSSVAQTVYVFGSDYKTGELRTIEGDSAISASGVAFNQDSKLVVAGGNMFVLERYGADNIVLFDAEKGTAAWQVSAGEFSNPADIVAAGEGKAWVALEGTASFIQISTMDGKIEKTVKTDSFVSAGGYSPNLVDFEVSGDTLFAIFQRYVYDATTYTTNFPKGLLAMYKLSDGSLLDTIQLATKNPMAVKAVNGNIYVATQGEYNAAFGTDADDNRGIEKIDLAQKASVLYVSGKKLGGGVSNMVVDYNSGIAYAAVYQGYGFVPVAKVDLSTGDVTTIKDIADAEGGLAYDEANGLLYVGDRSYESEKVLVYDGSAVVAIDNGNALAPYSIVLF